MQASQVREYLPGIKRTIDNAAELCQITRDVPDDVREVLGELDRESERMLQLLEQYTSEEHVRQSMLHLEKIGDRVLQACRQAGAPLDEEVQQAIQQAHDAIADLTRRLLH